MCGICGLGFEDRALIRKINDALIHRGPDSSGYYIDRNISLGIRRLKIIDLKTGDQPIYNENKSIVTVYNGEIYNFKELRHSLEELKHNFYTQTDTEVIVHLYEEYNESFPKYLDGMFAIALYDIKKRKLILVRDRLGIKPLYYTIEGDFCFASELKALMNYEEIKREINPVAFHNYLSFGYVPGPYSIFKNIKKLEPGYILVRENGKLRTECYYDLEFNEKTKKSEEQLGKELLSTLGESVKSHLISDVPLGAFLSGGIDSSSIVALMSKFSEKQVKTFSIGFSEQDYDELKYARIVAEHFNTDHKEFVVTPNLLNVIGEIIWSLDEPYSDPGAFPVYYVSKMARRHVTVALAGEGGDEIFAGYPRYHEWPQDNTIKKYKTLPSPIKSLGRNVFSVLGENKLRKYDKIDSLSKMEESELWFEEKINLFAENEKKLLYAPDIRESSFEVINKYYNRYQMSQLNKKLYTDTKTYLVDNNLHKVDRMSMLHSLEVRVPLLSNKMVSFVSSLPPEMKARDNNGKYLMKKTMMEILPNAILERKKKGFALPLKYWLRKELYTSASSILDKSTVFKKEYVKKLLEQHKSNERNNDRRIWTLISYEIWKKIYLEGINYKKISI
ncbi:MAG: asparagine synthase (glutamine-hydrolyzing) [Nanoarchaeota archaeon]